jgi:hypothetical protein
VKRRNSILTALALVSLILPPRYLVGQGGPAPAHVRALYRLADYSRQLNQAGAVLTATEQRLLQERSELVGRFSRITASQREYILQARTVTDSEQRDTLNELLMRSNSELSNELIRLQANQDSAQALAMERLELERQRRALETAEARVESIAMRLRDPEAIPADGGFRDDYEDAVFLAAKVTGDKVGVTIVSLPVPGALVYYVTKRGRDRSDPPETLARQTNYPQEIIRGCYFIWAEWQDGRTTDRNRKECIEYGGLTIDVR